MATREFWENVGLFHKQHISHEELVNAGAVERFCLPLHQYCDVCKLVTTWKFNGREDMTAKETPINGLYSAAGNVATKAMSKIVYLRYGCMACSQETKEFILRFNVRKNKNKAEIYYEKIGQYPQFPNDPPKEFENWDKELLTFYQRGKACEDHGFGIGAFAYYRRIVERTIDSLLNDVALFFDSPETKERYMEELAKAEAEQALNEAKATINAQRKIELVKNMLPQILRPGNIDPLGVLHKALSIGIHDEDEEFCLKLAGEIRNTLVALMRRLAIVKDDEEVYRNSIQAVVDGIHQKARDKKERQQQEQADSISESA